MALGAARCTRGWLWLLPSRSQLLLSSSSSSSSSSGAVLVWFVVCSVHGGGWALTREELHTSGTTARKPGAGGSCHQPAPPLALVVGTASDADEDDDDVVDDQDADADARGGAGARRSAVGSAGSAGAVACAVAAAPAGGTVCMQPTHTPATGSQTDNSPGPHATSTVGLLSRAASDLLPLFALLSPPLSTPGLPRQVSSAWMGCWAGWEKAFTCSWKRKSHSTSAPLLVPVTHHAPSGSVARRSMGPGPSRRGGDNNNSSSSSSGGGSIAIVSTSTDTVQLAGGKPAQTGPRTLTDVAAEREAVAARPHVDGVQIAVLRGDQQHMRRQLPHRAHRLAAKVPQLPQRWVGASKRTRVGSMATQELTQSPTPLKVALLRKQMSLSSLRKFHNFTRPSLQADATNDWSGDTDKLFTRCVCSWKCATWMPLGCQSAAGCATSCAPPPLPTRGTLSDVCNRLAAACCCPAPGAAAGRPVRKLSGSSVDSCACSMSMVLAGAALRRVVAGVVVGASSREEVATQRCIRLGAADGGIFGCCGGLSTTCTLYSGACTALNACSDGACAAHLLDDRHRVALSLDELTERAAVQLLHVARKQARRWLFQLRSGRALAPCAQHLALHAKPNEAVQAEQESSGVHSPHTAHGCKHACSAALETSRGSGVPGIRSSRAAGTYGSSLGDATPRAASPRCQAPPARAPVPAPTAVCRPAQAHTTIKHAAGLRARAECLASAIVSGRTSPGPT
eukprot:scaffold659_cov329-Prasinococcus_capsulatus_cf.AAC.29